VWVRVAVPCRMRPFPGLRMKPMLCSKPGVRAQGAPRALLVATGAVFAGTQATNTAAPRVPGT